jgi:hypothetical protein
MPALGDSEHPNRSARPPLYGLDLPPSAVLILFALYDEHWRFNGRQYILDVPPTELGMQPDIVPSPECDICIRAMMPRQART